MKQIHPINRLIASTARTYQTVWPTCPHVYADSDPISSSWHTGHVSSATAVSFARVSSPPALPRMVAVSKVSPHQEKEISRPSLWRCYTATPVGNTRVISKRLAMINERSFTVNIAPPSHKLPVQSVLGHLFFRACIICNKKSVEVDYAAARVYCLKPITRNCSS